MVELDILKRNSKGEQVKTVQILLNGKGYKDSYGNELEVDGKFGPKTQYAVKNFQKDHDLEQDGEVGKNTWDMLLKNE